MISCKSRVSIIAFCQCFIKPSSSNTKEEILTDINSKSCEKKRQKRIVLREETEKRSKRKFIIWEYADKNSLIFRLSWSIRLMNTLGNDRSSKLRSVISHNSRVKREKVNLKRKRKGNHCKSCGVRWWILRWRCCQDDEQWWSFVFENC